MDGEGAGFDGGLGLGVAVEAAEDELDLGLDFGERRFGLCVGKKKTLEESRTGSERLFTYRLVVDGCAEVEACGWSCQLEFLWWALKERFGGSYHQAVLFALSGSS